MRHTAMRSALMFFTLLLCAGCGASKSTPAGMSPTSWVGTWSGQVNWTGTDSGDNVTITITAPATNPGACGSGESTYTSQFTGTDSGGQCAQSGPIDLVGSVETCTGSYNNNPIATAIVNPGVQGPNGPTCNIPAQEGWNVSANSITISNGATTIGTLTKQ
jgi:hypothetical protein